MTFLYPILLLLTCRYPNNEHENDFINGQRVDFERVVYASEIGNEDYMENDDLPPDLLRLVEKDERQILPHQEITEAINLGIEEEKKEVKIGTTLSPATRKELIDLLQDYNDVFAWLHQDMPGLDIDIVVHRLPLREECMPVKQKLRRVKPEMLLKIKEEVKKQLDAGFLEVARYPQWVANIVPVLKKDGKVRMCVDYRDLNRASPQDNFPLPHIDTLVDNIQSCILCFPSWTDSRVIIRLEWRQKTWKRLHS